jgi:hypothetical protein
MLRDCDRGNYLLLLTVRIALHQEFLCENGLFLVTPMTDSRDLDYFESLTATQNEKRKITDSSIAGLK